MNDSFSIAKNTRDKVGSLFELLQTGTISV